VILIQLIVELNKLVS